MGYLIFWWLCTWLCHYFGLFDPKDAYYYWNFVSNTCILAPKFSPNMVTGHLGYVVGMLFCYFTTCMPKLGCVGLEFTVCYALQL